MGPKRQSKRKSASYSRTKSSRKKSALSKPAKQTARVKPLKRNSNFPIVGIGGSAGGFEAAMELRPYRTIDNKIDGAGITLVDLEGRKDSLCQ